MLIGATYKIKSPLVEHALYVTINDIVLNPGTEHELRRPFEIFVNSKKHGALPVDRGAHAHHVAPCSARAAT